MAFFCPGSSVKLKKELDSHRRQYEQGIQSSSQAYPSTRQQQPTGYLSPQVTSRHTHMMDRVQDNGPHPPISTQFFPKMIVLHDHYPEREMELAVRKGEKVEVVKKEPEWLFVRNERGKEGYIPARNCVAPVTRRSRSNSRSSIPVRNVMSGEIEEGNGRGRGVPMFASSSAGKVRRHGSPMDFDPDSISIQRVNSPPSFNPTTSTTSTGEAFSTGTSSSTTFDAAKCSLSSSSGVASLMDPSSPAMTRAFSQDEMKPCTDENAMFSLSQSAIDPNTTSYDKSIIEFSRTMDAIHRHKHSSSDDSGTVDSTPLKDVEYASTIRNDDMSSDEGPMIRLDRVSSGGNTPMKDRPLPIPPCPQYDKASDCHTLKEDMPPPVPPRNVSLATSKQRRMSHPGPRPQPPLRDDFNPYAQPVDSIANGPIIKSRAHSLLQQQQQQVYVGGGQSRSSMDITVQNSGVDSPYSEVYRPQAKRPINVQEGRGDSPTANRKSFSRNVQGTCGPVVRRNSPLVNGSDHTPHSPHRNDEMITDQQQSKGITKFRKYQWGVFMCMKAFEGVDENEVSVAAGEQVLVFNRDDQFWFWVFKHKTDRTEGFVPSSILREVEGKKSPIAATTEPRQTQSLKATLSPPIMLSATTGRPRGHTTSNSHQSSGTSHRTRVNSIGNNLSVIQQKITVTSSIEKIPFDSNVQNPAPSSPPPPYSEQDHISYSHSSQPTTLESGQVTRSRAPRTNSQSIVRNRPPTYPRSRASTSQMYPSSPLSPMMHHHQGHISQSAQRLTLPTTDSFYRDHHSNIPCSPVATTTGGTLV